MDINFALGIQSLFQVLIMKKVIAILIVFFIFGQFKIEGTNLCMSDRDNKNEEINVIEKNKADSFNDTRTRSLGPAVSACLDTEMGQIEIVFHVSIGNATLYILNDMGQALQSYGCDTETEWIVFLPAPTCEGHYTLKIDSDAAEYTGEFTL